ncbi:gliding motility-associated C-terminal domain-containing protein [Flavobacterium sp. LHD-80]|uniref:PKD domain-containing protein n=1 Tax=Flavobacterium sp. LHD-80 TaxID=3071411 RepID=UPI0027DFB410|nr:gliding motility-associated C-terminal domain-containing protein [Flavobacterium sp. LHD-80]MDQ6473090.1 gliding motility-associated C-terminal domain-containing protein [Flavobacterium sp. LHD-80]
MKQFYHFAKIKNYFKKLVFTVFVIIFYSINGFGQNCTVNAGVLNVTICETDVLVLEGNTPSPIIGNVLWSQISGPAVVINSPNTSTSTVSGYTGGNTYIFRYSATCGDGMVTYQDKVVNVQPITIANAGNNITSCPNSSGTLTITANTPQNTGEIAYWEIVGANNAGVVIDFPNLPTSTITLPPTSCGTTTIQWVIEGPEYAAGQRCRTTSQITVTNYGGVKPVSAGPDQTLSNCYTTTQTTDLTGTYGGCGLNGQNGQWTFVSGPNTPTIGNPNSNKTQISNLVEGTYTFRWTVSGPCASGNDLVTIVVPPATQDVTTLSGGDENIFFCDNTINQVTLIAQTPLYAGETVQWTQIQGDLGAVIVSPNNPTTLVTNISDAGDPYRFRYTLTNTNTGCVFTKDYIVQYNGATRSITANNGNNISGSCDATVFTIPLTVTGTGYNQYRIVSGPSTSPLGPFPTILTDVGTTLTLTLTTSGNYIIEFIRRESGSLPIGCDYGFDSLNVLVSGEPTPSNAGSDVSLPCGDTTTLLSGVATDEGTHFWNQLSGPNEAVIADSFAIDTQVSGLVPGEYVFQYITKGGGATCGFSVATVTINVSGSTLSATDAGPNQVVCTSSQVPLNAIPVQSGEIGTWSQISGPSTITFSNVNDPNAVATGFTVTSSEYELQWTISYLHPGPSCSASISDTVSIATNNSTASSSSDAGPDACYPSGTSSFNLSGNSPDQAETGTWTVVPSVGVIIADENDPNTMVTVPGNGTYVFTWAIETATRLCDPNKSSVSITIANTPPEANAGPDQELCGTTVTMAATASSGAIGTWTRISGLGGYTISDEHDPNAVFTFAYSGYYIFRWTINAEVCGEAFDDINLTIGIPPVAANAGPDQNICGSTSITMAGSSYDSFFESGQWSVLTGSPNQPNIVNPSSPNTVINGLVAGTYTFRWTITAKSIFLCNGTQDDVTVVVTPAAYAGSDQTFCDVTSIQLKGNENSTGTWTLTSTTGNVNDVVITQSPSNNYVANATVVPGNSYVFTYTTNSVTYPDGSTCSGSSDSVDVTVFSGASIEPNAGPDQILCISDVGGTASLTGNVPPPDVSVAEWRFVYQPVGSVAVITTPTAPLTTVTGLTVPGLYILEWVFENASCRSLSDIVRIEMNAAPSTANAGPDDAAACQTTYQTAAVPPAVGIGTWSFASPGDDPSGGAVVINNPNSPTTTLSNITTLGTYRLTWTVTNGPFTNPSLCQPSSDTVEITFNDIPPSIANAGPDQELCGEETAVMAAQAVTSGIGTWTMTSGPNMANIASPNSENSIMLGLVPGTYEFLWTVTTLNLNGCISEDSVIVTIYDLPSTANAGPDQTIPQFSPVNMNAVTPTVGTGEWTHVSGPSTVGFTDETSPTTAVTGTVSGTYVLRWTVSNGNCTVSSDTMTLTILSVADLELTKSITPMTGSAGDTVTFSIQVFNNNSLGGTVDATGVAVRDYIPTGYTIIPGSANFGGQYNIGDNTISWYNLTVPNGNRITLTFKAVVLPTGSYLNMAEVIASNQFDPDSTPNNNILAEDDQDDADFILDVADLSLQKTVSPTTVSINDNVVFTIRVTNSGPNNASGITVSDHLPPGYTYVSDNGAGKYNNTTGIWNVGNLNNGNSLTLQITAKVNVATAANYINTAEIQTAKQLDPDSTPGNGLPEDDMASANITLKSADLELTKTVSPTSATAGQQVNFIINVVNKGPGNATGVNVQDIIPVGYTLIPGSVSNGGVYQVANASIDWQNLVLASGANINLTFNAFVNPLGSYVNVAQITASDLPDPDSTPNNNVATEDDQDTAEITFIGPSADLSLVKNVVAGNTSPVVGSQVSFELVITNSGPNNATGVQVTDLLPTGFEFINYSSSAGIYNDATGLWNVGTVDVGVSESLIIDAKVLPTGIYTNVSQVTASNLPDPDSTPNNDDGDQSEDDEDNAVITPIQPSADLSVTKSVNNPTPLVGSQVTFEVIVTNNGPQDNTSVQVTDLLPNGYTFNSFTVSTGIYDPGTGVWTVGNLVNGKFETLQITATVNPTGDYLNKTEVTASDLPDPDSTPNNGSTTEDDYAEVATVPVPVSSDLSITKTVSNATPVVGTPVTFAVIVTNSGPQDNTGVQITDLLPSGYTYNSFTVSTGAYDPITGVWTVGNLVNGKFETLQVTATVNASGIYLNTAEITAANVFDPDSTPNNGITTEDDYAEVSTVPIPEASDLSITKTVTNATPVVGTQITFAVIVTNNGPQDNAGVQVTDLLPSGYAFNSFTVSTGAYDPITGVWTVGNLANGKFETLQVTATVNPSGIYLNTAEITAANVFDPDSTPNNGITTEDDYAEVSTVPIPEASDLSITKTVTNATPVVGTQVTFAVIVTNNGPQDNADVQVTDLLPSGYTFNSFTVSTGAYDPITGVWTVGNLANGKFETLQVTATVNASGIYLNTAEITAANVFDPDSTPNNGNTTEDDYAEVATIPVSTSADLSLSKTVSNATPLVGSQVTFSLEINNNGPQDTDGVIVTDLLPSGYTYVSYTTTTGNYSASTGLWNIGILPVSASHTLQITAVVNATGNYLNTAEVTASNQPDPDSTPNNGVTTEDDYAEVLTTPIPTSADLSLTKTVNNSTLLIGSQVTFSVEINNAGPQETNGVIVTDLLPSGYTYVSYSATNGTYNPITGLWTIGILPVSTSHTLQITATVNPSGDYVNIAEVTTSTVPDPDSTPNNGVPTEDDYATATVTPTNQASDLSLTKTVNNTTPLVGSQVIFEVIVTNNGPQDNTGVQVTDLLPIGYTLNSFTISTGTYNSATGLWNVGNLINGKSETLQLTATVNATGDYLNIAEVTAASLPDPDSTPNNGVPTEDDYATATVTPTNQASDLSLTKTVNNTTPLVGSQVIFEVIVTNNGPQDNTGVQVTDLLPTGYSLNSFTISTGTYNSATGLWNVGNLINGKSETLQITATVNLTGSYLNVAEITAAGLPDPDSTPNNGVTTEDDYGSVVTTPITQAANLSLTKTVNNPAPLVGTAVTFEIVVTNNGPQNVTGAEVTDLLPSGYTYNSFTATKGTYDKTTGKWNIGSLLNGDSQTLQLTANVNATGNYINIAEVTASSLPDPNSTPNNGVPTEDDYATATVTPTQAIADLSLVKSVVGGDLSPIFGATITFEITVKNSGPQAATGVKVKDLLPSGYEYVVYSSTTGQYFDTTGIWDVGTIANGGSESLLISAQVNNTGDYHNVAEVYASNEFDPDSTPNNNVDGEDDISSVVTTPVPAVADLSIEKSVVNNNLTPAVGSQISFSITVTNSGPSMATGVTIKDILPSGYDFIFFNSTSGSYDRTTGIWSPGVILPGNSHTLLINVFVKSPTGTANEYLNSAEVINSNQFDPDSTPGNGVTTEDDYDSISVTPRIVMADLSINKTALNENDIHDVGSTVIFTVTVTNDGPADASGVVVKDLLPPGFTYFTSSPTSGLYNYVTGVWNVGSIANGTNQSLDIYTTVNPPTGVANEYTNTTEIIASNLPDPDSTPNNGITTEDDYDSLQIKIAVADLSLDKTVSNKNANVNEVVTYTIQINNEGPSIATGVDVEDVIPLGIFNISNINNGGIFSKNVIKWVDLTIPVGGMTLTYQATVASPHGLDSNDYLNIAQVTASNQFDPDSKPNNDNGDQSEDDEDSEFINIPSTDIAINKEVDKTDVPMGSEVIFIIKAENLGSLTATNVEVQDILPNGYSLNSFTTTSGVYNSTTGIWTIPAVNAGSSQTLTINAKVQDFNDYVNTAHLVKMDQVDTNSSNNQDSATVSPNCLKIYNEFSPNDDGQNDTFYIDCITQYPDNQLQIFNRWGNLVYYRKGYDNTWDGKADGSAKTLPEGTYFYILDLGNGSAKKSGWLYLK